jgi:hypothetical protein
MELMPDARDETVSGAPVTTWVGFSIDLSLPKPVLDWMDERELELAHNAWHSVRRWDDICGASFASGAGCDFAQSLMAQGLERAESQQGGPGSGKAFLAMHRHMLQTLRAAFPTHAQALFGGFSHVPRSRRDTENPTPWRNLSWTRDNLIGFDILEHIEDHVAEFADDDALGLYIESNIRWTPTEPVTASNQPGAGVHGALHTQWSVNRSPANLGRTDTAVRNYIFWKLHGFLDDVWTRYRAAKGLDDADHGYLQLIDDECVRMHELSPANAH